jgi:two-component system, response regulator, stage 0 sporulation protein F
LLRILLVEDEQDQRNLYKDSFADAGFEVVAAKNGVEALKRFNECRPDAIVLDIQMPGMDGIEAIGKLLAHDKSVAVVFYSAYPTFKTNFMTWAADAFVVKTGDSAEIVNEVSRILKERGMIPAVNVDCKTVEKI